MPAAVTCATCNRPLQVPESALGRTVQCPLCLDEFVAQPDPAAAAAAEAAAREAETAARRNAAKAAAVAAVTASPAPAPAPAEDEILEAIPVAAAAGGPAKAAPKAGPERKSFVFPVLVSRDPDRVLRGRMDAELTGDGLYLRRPRQAPAFAAVGAPARYLGGSRLVVTVEGREVELSVVQPRASVHHLAQDAAAFLNGRRALPAPRDYHLPWYLFALPAAAVLLPVVGIAMQLLVEGVGGGFLWVFLGGVTAGLTFAVAKQAWLRPRGRLIGAGAVVGLACAGLLIAAVASLVTPSPYAIDPTVWTSYTPPNAVYKAQWPGRPQRDYTQGAYNNYNVEVYTVSPNGYCTFAVLEMTPAAGNFGAPPPQANTYQATEDAKGLLRLYLTKNSNTNNYPSSYYPTLALETSRIVSLPGGVQGSEVVYTFTKPHEKDREVVARFFAANGKVYVLFAMGPKYKATSDDVVKFLNSFQLTAPAKPARTPPPVPREVPGLVLYWSFGQGGGPGGPPGPGGPGGPFVPDRLFDDTGKGRVCSPTQAHWADGVRDQALGFNGDGGFADFADAPEFSVGARAEFTFAVWVRPHAPSGVIFSNHSDRDDGPLQDVFLRDGQVGARFRPNLKPNAPLEMFDPKQINDGGWHHVALVRRGNLGAIQLYVDGASRSTTSSPWSMNPVSTNLHGLACQIDDVKRGGLGGGSYLAADFDDFCIFNRALTDDELKKLAGGGP
jgi:hypothetical protein